MVSLAALAAARSAARFGGVIKRDHAEARAPRHRNVRPVPAHAQPECGSVQALVRTRLAPYLSREMFEAHLRTIPAVRSAVHIIGDVDYEIRLTCRDLADLGAVLSGLRRCRGTEVVSTALVLGEVEGLGRRTRSVPDWGAVPRPRQTRSA
jgi:DNA-binding Lrp family transcriptional regulator